MKLFRILAATCLLLVVIPSTFSQTQDETGARALIAQALTQLTTEGYAYTQETTSTQQYIQADAETTTQSRQIVTGEITADADSISTVTVFSINPATGEDAEGLTAQKIVIADAEFLNISYVDESLGATLAEGWQTKETALTPLNQVQRAALDALLTIDSPSTRPLTDEQILSVEEYTGEILNDIEMRVFVLDVDPVTLLLPDIEMAPEERIKFVLDNMALYQAGEFSLQWTLWIGAEDGQLYQGVGEASLYLPYKTTETANIPYDIITQSHVLFTITQHGDIAPLTAPELLATE